MSGGGRAVATNMLIVPELRIFISGLNGAISETLFSLSPPDLPNALVQAQELE